MSAAFVQGTVPWVAQATAMHLSPIDLTAVQQPQGAAGSGSTAQSGPAPVVMQVDATTTRLTESATPAQMEANFRYAKNVASAKGRPHSVIFWDACTDPRDPRWWVRTYYPNGTWGEDTLEGHETGSLAGKPAPMFVAAHRS